MNNRRLVQLAVILAAFTVFSTHVTLQEGYWGFMTLALSDLWGGQIFLDLVIALTLFSMWMKRDARQRGLPWLPYLIALPFTGSISALAYLIHREWAAGRAPITARRSGSAA